MCLLKDGLLFRTNDNNNNDTRGHSLDRTSQLRDCTTTRGSCVWFGGIISNHLQYIDPTINVCKYWFSRVHSHSSPTTSTTTTALWVCHLTAQMSCAVHSQLLVEWGLPASDPPLNVEHTKAPTTRHTPSPVYVISTCPASMQCTSPPPLSLFSLNVITSILISRSRLCRPQMDYYYYYGYTLWLKGARTNDRARDPMTMHWNTVFRDSWPGW